MHYLFFIQRQSRNHVLIPLNNSNLPALPIKSINDEINLKYILPKLCYLF